MLKLKKYLLFFIASSLVIVSSSMATVTAEECAIFKPEKTKYTEDKNLTDMILSGDIDLKFNEENGGHVIKKHIGHDYETLEKRLECEPKISASSGFNNIEQATHFISEVLKNKNTQLKQFYKTSKPNASILLSDTFEEATGIKVAREGLERTKTYKVAVAIRKINSGLVIVTSYPQ